MMELNLDWYRDRVLLIELFVLSNMAFLGFDIYIAHSANIHSRWTEWIPIFFSFIATIALAYKFSFKDSGLNPIRHTTGMVVGWLSIVVGITGMVLHLQSQLFQEFSIKSLVYTAPFVAPLSFTGVGLLLLMNRMVKPGSNEWSKWVIFLSLGGFFGNFILALCDHAQNGFFSVSEWIPVFGSAMAVGFLTVTLFVNTTISFLKLCMYIMLIQIVIGCLGLYFHLTADQFEITRSIMDSLTYGPPVFAPLLLPNLALLALIGCWDYTMKLGNEQTQKI